jgi:hypothetical protein
VLKIARVSGKDLWDDAIFCETMKFVGKYAENLYWLQISIHENHDWSRDVLENGFFPMIQNISHQLTKVTLDLEGMAILVVEFQAQGFKIRSSFG